MRNGADAIVASQATGIRLTEDIVTKDCPPALAALERRAGERPRIARQFPCLQLTDAGDPATQAAILHAVRAWPGVTIASAQQTIPHCQAISLDAGLARGQGEAFILGREFAHVRIDGSVHAALAPEWGEEILRKGWGEIHPLALYGLIPPQSFIFYSPRTEAELAVMVTILEATYSYACGRIVVCE